jgi:hypothetical protein
VIFSRPDAGLAGGFGTSDGAGRSAVAGDLVGAELPVAELLVDEFGGTSTFTNVLCGSTLAGVSMPGVGVASQSNADRVAVRVLRLPLSAVAVTIQSGEVSERLNELASKASVGETQPGVRIPPSPPGLREGLRANVHCFGDEETFRTNE